MTDIATHMINFSKFSKVPYSRANQGRRKQREVEGALHYKGNFFIKKGQCFHCFILKKGHFGEKLGGHMPPMPPVSYAYGANRRVSKVFDVQFICSSFSSSSSSKDLQLPIN